MVWSWMGVKMDDKTRDALLIVMAELLGSLAWANPLAEKLPALIARATEETISEVIEATERSECC